MEWQGGAWGWGGQKATEARQQDKKESTLPRRPPQHVQEEASVIR